MILYNMTQEKRQALAYKSFADVVVDGFKLFFRNYVYILIPFAIFYTAIIVVETFLLPDLIWQSSVLTQKANKVVDRFNSNPESVSQSELNSVSQSLALSLLIMFIMVIIETVFTVLALISTSNFLYEKYTLGTSSFSKNFKSAFKRDSKLIYVLLIVGVASGAGFILFIIPGLIIIGFYIFLVFVYNSKDVPKPITEARLIAKGSFWKILSVFFISFAITYTIEGTISLILDLVLPINTAPFYNPDTRNYGMIIVYGLLHSIAAILLGPLFICLLTPLFASLKAQKELGIIEKPVRYAPAQPYYQPYPAPPPPQYYTQASPVYPQPMPPTQYPPQYKPQSSGFFCPFCGYRITNPKKFCLNCGERLPEL